MNREDILRIADEAQVLGNTCTVASVERIVACVQKREWIDLTDDEIWKVIEEQSAIMGWKVPPTRQVALAVQAKLKELNHK